MSKIDTRFTPINRKYPTCERTYAELRVYSDEVKPNKITDILGETPSSQQSKGSKRISSRGNTIETKINGWFLSSESQLSSLDLRDHLSWLMEKLAPKILKFEKLREKKVVMTVYCLWWSAHGHGGPTLWPEQMKILSDLELECSIDFSYFGDEEV